MGLPETALSAGRGFKKKKGINPEAARTSYFDAVRALEDVDFPLVNLLKSKKDAGMDELFRPHPSFLMTGAIVGETSLSCPSLLLNVQSRATLVGETSTSAAPLSVKDFDEEDTDEDLGSVVAIPKFEACRF
ncbi:hypothetical protein Tco_0477373 [Tanacetum coccineum]